MSKCTPREGAYAETLCDAMKETAEIHRPSKRSKGMYRQMITNMTTRERRGTRIVIYSGDSAVDGIVANTCPFCGGKLHDMFEYTDIAKPIAADEGG